MRFELDAILAGEGTVSKYVLMLQLPRFRFGIIMVQDKLLFTDKGVLPVGVLRVLGFVWLALGVFAAGFFVFAAIYTKEWWVALLSLGIIMVFMMLVAPLNTIEIWLKNNSLIYKEVPFNFFPMKPIPIHTIKDIFVETDIFRGKTIYFITIKYLDRSTSPFGSGRSQEKLTEIVEIIKEHLPNVQMFQQATALMDMESYRESLQLLTKIVASSPKDAEAWFHIGMANWQIKERKKALSAFSKCIALDSQNSVAYMNRSILHYQLKMWPEALADLENHISLLPGVANHPKVIEMKQDLEKRVGIFN